MKKLVIYAALTLILFLIGCSYTRFTPSADQEYEDEYLISMLKDLTVKLDAKLDCSQDENDSSYGRPIYESQLFKEVVECNESADLIITDYQDSSFKYQQQGFANEGLAFMSLFGYIGTHTADYRYSFRITSSRTGESVSFGPLTYNKSTCAGWLFTPMVVLKDWHPDVKYSKEAFNPTWRRHWISILSTRKEELKRLISNIHNQNDKRD